MKWRASLYQLLLTFFGLTPQYRLRLFEQIDEIVTYGEGYDWTTVYNMPIWLRRFTYNRIQQRFEKKNAEVDKQNGILTAKNAATMIKPPTTQNSYTTNTKAPKS